MGVEPSHSNHIDPCLQATFYQTRNDLQLIGETIVCGVSRLLRDLLSRRNDALREKISLICNRSDIRQFMTHWRIWSRIEDIIDKIIEACWVCNAHAHVYRRPLQGQRGHRTNL